MNPDVQDNPPTLRQQLKERRAALAPAERERGGLLIRGRLFTWLATRRSAQLASGAQASSNIAAFWSMEYEPQLLPLLRQWAQDPAIKLSLPVVLAPDTPLELRSWDLDTPMSAGPYGILQPDSAAAPPPDVILVPTLGFTRQGDRIGYGGGFYDRTLAALKESGHEFVTIGIAWASGDLSTFAAGQNHRSAAHDYRLDSILTDKGWAVPAP